MPYIAFMWCPAADRPQVGPLVDALTSVAEAHNVNFYVNGAEELEEETVVLSPEGTLSQPTLQKLRELADGANVIIYVRPPD